ncbi:unnamed protein product [Heligmosomoides polygyrus]|uniref:Peroxisomal membrane protein PEX14 n=1 Tax=Heligmosomoides polygyrus TaxID=6339 RepID=A0A183FLG2_HELPZ|nr:unnamed protein product [Heligmosomoides polygyrus]
MGQQNRPEMVEAARKFMLTPKVRGTPFDEQRQFLLGKGVTEYEIDEARASIPEVEASSGPTAHFLAHGAEQPQQNRFTTLAQSAAMVGCMSYVGYRFVRSFILPRFFDIPDPATEEMRQLQVQVNELQNSIKFVLDSISQTTSMLSGQQQEINRALLSISHRDTDLSRVEDGISTIKSLLLSHNNFAPIITPSAKAALPSWQQPSSDPAARNGCSTPPANYKDTSEELESEEAASSDHGVF